MNIFYNLRSAFSSHLSHTSPPHLNAGVMVGIDICYNLHSAFGNWFPGSKTLILQVYGEVWV